MAFELCWNNTKYYIRLNWGVVLHPCIWENLDFLWQFPNSSNDGISISFNFSLNNTIAFMKNIFFLLVKKPLLLMTFFSLREKHFQIQTNKHKPNTKFYFEMSYFIIAQMPPQ